MSPPPAPATSETAGAVPRWLVVIGRHEARIYRSAAPGTAAQVIRPHAPGVRVRSDRKSGNFLPEKEKSGKLAPEGFFAPVAGLLNGAGKIVIFGNDTGSNAELDQFTDWLKRHRPVLAQRIVATLSIDELDLTEDELLAKARAVYANAEI